MGSLPHWAFGSTCIRHIGLRSKLLSTSPSDANKPSNMDKAFDLILGNVFSGNNDKVWMGRTVLRVIWT